MAIIIAITGIDGSGKTSTALDLTKSLSELGYNASYRHQFNSSLVKLAKRLRIKNQRRRIVKSQNINNDLNFNRVGAAKKVLAYAFLFYRALAARISSYSPQKIYVYDRYFYDDFVRAQLSCQISLRAIVIFDWIAPRPDISIFLGGDPETTYNRQADIDSSYERYMWKLGIHNDVIAYLKNLGIKAIEIDTTDKPKHVSYEMILSSVRETLLDHN